MIYSRHTVDNDQKELEESYKRRIEFYEQKLRTMKNNPENLCSDNDLRNEILEKDLLIEVKSRDNRDNEIFTRYIFLETTRLIDNFASNLILNDFIF